MNAAAATSQPWGMGITWLARGMTVMILGFWGFFLVAHLVGSEGAPSRPLTAVDYGLLAALLASLSGLAISWKRELAGVELTAAAVAVGAVLNPNVLAFPMSLIPLTAALYLVGWLLKRST